MTSKSDKRGETVLELSLWTLSYWLQKAGMTQVVKIERGEPCISRLELSDPSVPGGDSQIDPAAVNVCSAQAGWQKAATMLVNGDDIITIPEIGCIQVCNELVRAFEFYNNWESQLLIGLLKGASLQQLLDIAHTVFDRPMFIKSDSSWAFAITGGYDGAVHPDWTRMQESVTTRQSDMEAVRVVSMDPEFNKAFRKRYPTILNSPFYGGAVLHSNVWLGNHRVCEIIAIENGKPFNPGDAHLMQVFTSVVERYMNTNQNLYLSSSGMSALLVELLEGRDHDINNLKLACEDAGWGPQDELAVVTIGTHDEEETPVVSVLREQLAGGLLYSCVFTYGGKLVCVVNIAKHHGRQALVKRLRKLVPENMFCWGMSYEFLNIVDFPLYYRQSLAVTEKSIAMGRPWATMYQVALEVIHDRMEKALECQSLIHPDIRKLKLLDDQNGSQYLETVLEFLLCGGNYTDTANRLGLHRNSLIYRISRIKEIITTDLDDITNKELMLFSFLILPRDEKAD